MRRKQASQRRPPHRPGGSFLLRVWADEAGEGAAEGPRMTVYLRDLRTGEERYVSELSQIGDFLRGQLGLRQPETDEAAEAIPADGVG